MINMLRALLEKVDNMHTQMRNISRQMEIIRKNEKARHQESKHQQK